MLPFEKNKTYSIGHLRSFASSILSQRQQDPDLSARMRAPRKTDSWAKDWTEELFPLKVLAGHLSLSDDDSFSWTPAEAFDFEINAGGRRIRIQSTMAYPEWSVGSTGRGAGYIHSLEMRHSNEHGFNFGGGLVSEPMARGYEEDLSAWRAGIRTALTNKLRMQCANCRLLIFAGGCQFNNVDSDFADVVLPAIESIGRATWEKTFDGIYVVDAHESAFVEILANSETDLQ